MRKIVYGMAVSLDGFVEGPQGESDWMTYDPGIDPSEYIKPFDTFLMGRKSYQTLMKSGGSANAFPGIKQYVFSHSLKEVAKGFQLINGDGIAAVREMKEMGGKDIAVYGGAEWGASLLGAGLVDEVVLSVQSILLGEGRPMFQSREERMKMELMNAKPTRFGIILHYKVLNTR